MADRKSIGIKNDVDGSPVINRIHIENSVMFEVAQAMARLHSKDGYPTELTTNMLVFELKNHNRYAKYHELFVKRQGSNKNGCPTKLFRRGLHTALHSLNKIGLLLSYKKNKYALNLDAAAIDVDGSCVTFKEVVRNAERRRVESIADGIRSSYATNQRVYPVQADLPAVTASPPMVLKTVPPKPKAIVELPDKSLGEKVQAILKSINPKNGILTKYTLNETDNSITLVVKLN